MGPAQPAAPMTPPPAVPPAPGFAPTAPPVTPARAGAVDVPGLQRMLVAAGLDPNAAQQVAGEQLAETMGQIIRVFVKGMLDVLRARSAIKSQFRVPVTQIQPVENNPLKFCVDEQDALYSLFVNPHAARETCLWG